MRFIYGFSMIIEFQAVFGRGDALIYGKVSVEKVFDPIRKSSPVQLFGTQNDDKEKNIDWS